jgi:hypothetical protein
LLFVLVVGVGGGGGGCGGGGGGGEVGYDVSVPTGGWVECGVK